MIGGSRRCHLYPGHVCHDSVLLITVVASQAVIVGAVQEAHDRPSNGICAALVGSLHFLLDSKSISLRSCCD